MELVKAPNIGTLPDFGEFPANLHARVAIKVGDNISTDEIPPAGARVLPFRSDIAKLAQFTFSQVDEGYLANFGVLAVEFAGPGDYDRIEADDELSADSLRAGGQIPRVRSQQARPA